ncbi:hypothetical protein B0T10DRAFT_556640 [Thelonectria olida]|uniref:Peptidase A1 domain-containing protein n=1 Tax=Thelonectria olida TaxID=1576542 RepID=A0A9P8WFY0_9HYPO|nr:hypothetical protein B0T10DRAFT_556640 [Thelonectria olida]
MSSILPLLALVATFLLAVLASSPAPYEIPWSERSFGPDGPWNTIEATIGSSGTTLNLFAGATWESWVVTDDYCSSGTCYSSDAGTYDQNGNDGSSGGISMQAGISSFMLGLKIEGEDATRWMDTLTFSNNNVPNVSLALLDDGKTKISYPGGQSKPFFAGCLSVGAVGSTNQSFNRDPLPTVNASIVPGYMWEHNWTPSNSFGMHIGSVSPQLAGSLWFGGYDQNRVVGDILTSDGDFRQQGITLWDISIDVIGDNSPFEFDGDSKDGLLAKGNSTIGSSLKVLVDGCSPYLTLPKSTCEAISSYLPIYYNENLGLYLWNTTSDKYHQIVSSASALSFSFIADSNTDPITIRVPFMHLNLTLETPLSDNPKPYFPCHVNGGDRYTLGRAFLQDAFIGANWKVGKWWMAQAPGQNIQAVANTATIGEDDKSITKGGNDWKASWSGVWEDKAQTASSAASTPTARNEKDAKEDEVEGMTAGAKAGIAVGVVGAVLAIAGAFFFWWRRRRNRASSSTSLPNNTETQHPPEWSACKDYSYNQKQMWPAEMTGEQPSAEMHATEATSHRFELPS